MLEFAKLELRKNRILFLTLAGAFLASLPLAGAASALTSHPIADALSAALLFWTGIGLPLAAVLFAAAAGSDLRGQAAVESPLPLSAGERIGGAALGAALRFSAFALLVAGLVWSASGPWRGLFLWFLNYDASSAYRGALPALAFTSAQLFVASFACAYVSGSGVFGGVAGTLASLPLAAALAPSLGSQVFVYDRVPMTGPIFGAGFAAVAVSGAAFAVAGPWIDRGREPAWKAAALVAVGLVLAAASGPWAAIHIRRRVLDSLRLIPPEFASEHSLNVDSYSDPFAAPRPETVNGALFRDWKGSLWRVLPDGTRSLLLEGDGDTLNLIDFETAWACDGTLWVLKKTDTRPIRSYEVWHGRPDGRLSLITRLDSPDDIGLDRAGNQMALTYTALKAKGFLEFFAPLPLPGGPLRWRSFDGEKDPVGLYDELHRDAFLDGLEAELSGDSASYQIAGKTVRCTLPGKPTEADLHLMADGRPLVLAAFAEAKGGSLAVCAPDGSVRSAWRGLLKLTTLDWYGAGAEREMLASSRAEGPAPTPWRLQPMPDGGLWAASKDGALLLMDADGETHDPVRISGGLNGRLPVHMTKGSVWLIDGAKRLLRLDLSGALSGAWPLPAAQDLSKPREDGKDRVRAVRDGIFILTGRELYFMDWEGGLRDLGQA